MSLSAVLAACVCPLTPAFVSFLLAGKVTAVALPRARIPAVLGAAAV